jgi:glycosyltransferase involved in cell wall biosynthesis
VVATDAPGTVDLVEGGETGVLVPRGDSHALAEAAVSLLRDPERRRALAARARRLVLERYSVEKMVRAYERLYERCARQ